MTIEQLKELLSTYGSNDTERNAPILVNVNGTLTPITAGEVEYGTWDEETRAWVDLDQPHVLLQTEEVQQ